MEVRSGKKNPTYNKVVDMYLEGRCNNVKFTVKGGRSMIYDYSDTEDWRTIKRLIAKPLTGCSWSSVCSKVSITSREEAKGIEQGEGLEEEDSEQDILRCQEAIHKAKE